MRIALSTHRYEMNLVTWQCLHTQAAIKQREDKLSESVIESVDWTGCISSGGAAQTDSLGNFQSDSVSQESPELESVLLKSKQKTE